MNGIRCPNCGSWSKNGSNICPICGSTLPESSCTMPSVSSTRGNPHMHPEFSTPITLTGSQMSTSASNSQPNHFDLQGTVLSVSETHYEPVDFDSYRFFSLILIFLELLPLFLFYIAFRLAIIISLRIMGFHAGRSLFGHLFWIMIGRGSHGRKREEPVFNVVVRTHNGKQHIVRIKGHLVRGTLQSGDSIAVNGKWDSGTLLFRKGYNFTTNSDLRLRFNYWKLVLFIQLVFVLGAIIYASNLNLR